MSSPRLNVVTCSSPVGVHRMAYHEWGAPDNPDVVLCVHGLTRTGRDFDDLAQALAADFRVVCPDVVGRGLSDRLANPMLYAVPQYASDMVTLVARLNPARLGAAMMVFVEVLLDRTTPNVFEQFKAAVQVHPQIMECHMVAGGFDYLLKTRMADMAAYREFAGTVLWQLPGVRETRTYAVMEEVKSTTRLPL